MTLIGFCEPRGFGNTMHFNFLSLSEAGEADGMIVVIDVLRAFTTAAYAFYNGADKIIPVGSTREAFEVKEKFPGSLVMGEVEGFKPRGFDFGNSPEVIANQDLSNRTLIQRTSAGTQGLVRAKTKTNMLAASFVVAKATAEYLKRSAPALVSFIITGDSLGRDGDEDLACAEYIAGMIKNEDLNPDMFTSRILTSSVGRAYLQGEKPYLTEGDIKISGRVDLFNFIMYVKQEDDLLVMHSKVI